MARRVGSNYSAIQSDRGRHPRCDWTHSQRSRRIVRNLPDHLRVRLFITERRRHVAGAWHDRAESHGLLRQGVRAAAATRHRRLHQRPRAPLTIGCSAKRRELDQPYRQSRSRAGSDGNRMGGCQFQWRVDGDAGRHTLSDAAARTGWDNQVARSALHTGTGQRSVIVWMRKRSAFSEAEVTLDRVCAETLRSEKTLPRQRNFTATLALPINDHSRHECRVHLRRSTRFALSIRPHAERVQFVLSVRRGPFVVWVGNDAHRDAPRFSEGVHRMWAVSGK
jgi:hypothetical protein